MEDDDKEQKVLFKGQQMSGQMISNRVDQRDSGFDKVKDDRIVSGSGDSNVPQFLNYILHTPNPNLMGQSKIRQKGFKQMMLMTHHSQSQSHNSSHCNISLTLPSERLKKIAYMKVQRNSSSSGLGCEGNINVGKNTKKKDGNVEGFDKENHMKTEYKSKDRDQQKVQNKPFCKKKSSGKSQCNRNGYSPLLTCVQIGKDSEEEGQLGGESQKIDHNSVSQAFTDKNLLCGGDNKRRDNSGVSQKIKKKNNKKLSKNSLQLLKKSIVNSGEYASSTGGKNSSTLRNSNGRQNSYSGHINGVQGQNQSQNGAQGSKNKKNCAKNTNKNRIPEEISLNKFEKKLLGVIFRKKKGQYQMQSSRNFTTGVGDYEHYFCANDSEDGNENGQNKSATTTRLPSKIDKSKRKTLHGGGHRSQTNRHPTKITKLSSLLWDGDDKLDLNDKNMSSSVSTPTQNVTALSTTKVLNFKFDHPSKPFQFDRFPTKMGIGSNVNGNNTTIASLRHSKNKSYDQIFWRNDRRDGGQKERLSNIYKSGGDEDYNQRRYLDGNNQWNVFLQRKKLKEIINAGKGGDIGGAVCGSVNTSSKMINWTNSGEFSSSYILNNDMNTTEGFSSMMDGSSNRENHQKFLKSGHGQLRQLKRRHFLGYGSSKLRNCGDDKQKCQLLQQNGCQWDRLDQGYQKDGLNEKNCKNLKNEKQKQNEHNSKLSPWQPEFNDDHGHSCEDSIVGMSMYHQ